MFIKLNETSSYSLHTGYEILVCQADSSQAVRRHALDDVADKLVTVRVSESLQLTTAAQNPAASDHDHHVNQL